MRDWLHELGCTHVGMEATGIYWKPVHALQEDDFEVIVGNAYHIKNVRLGGATAATPPGR